MTEKTHASYSIPSILLIIIYFVIGILILFFPIDIMITAVYFVGVIFMVSGVLILTNAFSLFERSVHRDWNILDGVLSIIVGCLFLFGNVWISIDILVYLLMFWFIITSAIQLYIFTHYPFPLKKLAIILNIVVILLAIYSFFDYALAIGVFVWVIALQFIFRGVSELNLLLVRHGE